MNLAIKAMKGEVYKRYRVYEKAIARMTGLRHAVLTDRVARAAALGGARRVRRTPSQAEATSLRSQLRTAMRSRSSPTARARRAQPAADRHRRSRRARGPAYPELRAAFGSGSACRTELCEQQGFTGSDWYYAIGREADKGSASCRG